jgi:hypothetical protein
MDIRSMSMRQAKRKMSKKSTRAAQRRAAEISKPAKSKSKKPGPGRGPGRPKLFSEKIVVIVPRHQVDQLDAWRVKQNDKPIRAEAIRRLITAGIDAADIDLPPDLLAALDTWRMSRPVPHPDRPGAIYHLLTMALKRYGIPTPSAFPAPERIHAEGERANSDAATRMPPAATESLTDEGTAQEPAPEPIPDVGWPSEAPESPVGEPEADHET